jgi:hypothetical protein
MGGRAALPPLLGRDGAEILEEGVRRSGGAASIRRRSGESSVPVEASRDLTLPLAACSAAVSPMAAECGQSVQYHLQAAAFASATLGLLYRRAGPFPVV